eukprot:15356156-Ditylum_brightwellii.AAC.1
MHHVEDHMDNGKEKDANIAEGKEEEKLLILPHSASTIAAATNAQVLWEKMYPTEPFFLPCSTPTDKYLGILTDQDQEKANP